MLHLETIEPKTLELLNRIQSRPLLAETRLVGGTALALQLGHRISIDLDIFGKWDLEQSLDYELAQCGELVRIGGQKRLQFFSVDGVKVDCVTYDYPWLDEPIIESGVRIAGLPDIAAMKINAITNRGTRKDFVDIAFLLKHYSLGQMFRYYLSKYADVEPAMALRSIVYFEDAEEMPMPRMLLPFDWEDAKNRHRSALRPLEKSDIVQAYPPKNGG